MTNKEFLKRIGMEIRIARIRRGLSVREVGQLTGLNAATVGSIENGKCDTKILSYKRIADALEVEMKNFL